MSAVRWSPWGPGGRGDALLAGALCVGCLVAAEIVRDGDDRPWWPGGAALIVAGSLVLLWRRRAPLVVLGLTLAIVASYYWLGYPDAPVSLLVVVAVYTVASRLSWPRSVAVGLGLLLIWVGLDLVLALARGPERTDPGDYYMWIVVTIAVGVAVGGLRRARDEAAERAEEQARRRIEQERLRLARSVHDVVSHSLASIAVQAGVGAHVADRRPEQAVAALLEIKETSRSALAELRATLDVLREGEADETREVEGLHRLDDVARVAGLAGVGVEVRGSPGELLRHEDDGMMAQFLVVGPHDGPATTIAGHDHG